MTIRQSWTLSRRELVQDQRRALLEIATDSDAPVDVRIAVLAFMSGDFCVVVLCILGIYMYVCVYTYACMCVCVCVCWSAYIYT